MLGILWEPVAADGWFAPTVPAASYPVGTDAAIARTIDSMDRNDLDGVLVVTDDPTVRRIVHDTFPDDRVRAIPRAGFDTERDAIQAAHDTVVLTYTSTVVDPDTIGALLEHEAPAVVARADDASGLRPLPAVHRLPVGTLGRGCDIESHLELDTSSELDTVTGYRTENAIFDVRRPWELLRANERWLGTQTQSIAGDIHPAANCRGRVVVEPSARIEAGAVVEGPAYVGPNVEIGPNAYVCQSSTLLSDVTIGHGVEVENTVLFRGASIPHASYVGDSVLGPDSALGAGTQVANLRHDGKPVRVRHDEDRVSTGRRKFGTVVGANANLGAGTMVDAGVTIEPGERTGPGAVLTRNRGGHQE